MSFLPNEDGEQNDDSAGRNWFQREAEEQVRAVFLLSGLRANERTFNLALALSVGHISQTESGQNERKQSPC